MPTASEQLLNDAVLRAVRMERVENSHVRLVLEQLNQEILGPVHALAVEQIARQVGSGVDPRRLSPLLKELRAFLDPAYRELYATMRDELIPVAQSEMRWAKKNLETTLGRIEVKWDVKSPAMHQVRAVVTSDPFEGRLLRTWAKSLEESLLVDIRDQLVIGLAQGNSTNELERRLMGLARQRGEGGVYGKQRRAARSVARTSFIHTSNTARETLYKENEDIIKGVMWTSTLDTRTCPECGALDTQVFQPDEGQRPPAHHQCRCTTTPVLRSLKELGFDAEDYPESTRASMNGQVPESLSYPRWLKGQSIDIQNEVLGAQRAKMWRGGRLEFRDFTGSGGRILTLRELESLAE